MNEEELKAIWKKEENFAVENLDFERIRQIVRNSQKKLRRKIKWEMAINILTLILFSPAFYFYPKSLVVLPFTVAIGIWYLWEVLRIYKHENDFQKLANVKTFLVVKEKLLTNYIKRTRLLGYLGTPIFFLISYIGMTSFQHFRQTPLNFLLCLILVETLEIIFFELYIRKIYKPVLDEIKDLLRQLND